MRLLGAGLLLATGIAVVGPLAGASTPGTWFLGAPPALPTGAKILGPLPGSHRLSLVVTLAPRDPAALGNFVAAVDAPKSPAYHHFLERGAFADRFGPTAATVGRVTTTFDGLGLRAGSVSSDHLSLPVRSTASAIERALGIRFERILLADGRVTYSYRGALRLPGSLRGIVDGIGGLSDLVRPAPVDLEVAHGSPAHQASAAPSAPVASTASHTSPHAVPALGGTDVPATTQPVECASAASARSAFLTYDDDIAHGATELAGSYDLGPIYTSGDFGSGVAVAIYELETDPDETDDIASFDSCYGISSSLRVVDNGAFSSGVDDGLETQLDIETIEELAPAASIVVYQGPDTASGAYDTFDTIISNDTEKVISTSWGECEPDLGLTGADGAEAENTLFAEAAANGQSVLAAAGDWGAESCNTSSSSPDTELATLDPASQPDVTGVGGTTLSSSASTPPTETAWSDSGGGISREWAMPTYQSSAPSSLGVVSATSSDPNGAVSGDGCSSTVQLCREVPDVSADANSSTGYLIDYDASNASVPRWYLIGGTSGAAPLWAAIIALADATTSCGTSGVGLANPTLYALGGTSLYHSVFNDVTSGSNAIAGNHGTQYTAGVGYDLVTGLGTPIAGTLIPLLCAPIIDGVSPSAANVGATVTITGADLGGVTSITLGAVHTTPVSIASGGSSLTFTVPAGVAPSTSVDLVAASARTTSPIATQDSFTVGPPVITGVSATSGGVGSTVAISGTGLAHVTAVDFGGVPATFSVTSDGAITASVPATGAGTVDVTATNAAGTSGTSSSDHFTVFASPEITGVNPTSDGVGGGTSVTITGSGLASATSVTFGGVAATFTVNSDSSISAVSPAHSAGSVEVVVTTPGGSSTAAGTFTYGSPAAVSTPTTTTTTAPATTSTPATTSPTPVVPSDATSTVAVVPRTIATTARSTVTVTLRSAVGVPLGGRTVTLTATRGHPSIRPASAETTSTGSATFSVSDTHSGEVTVRATDATDGVELSAAVALDVVAPVAISDATSSTTASSPTGRCAGSGPHATVTVVLRTANGGEVAGRSVAITTLTGGHAVVAPANRTTSSDGAASFTVTDRAAESVRYRARDLTDGVTLSVGEIHFTKRC